MAIYFPLLGMTATGGREYMIGYFYAVRRAGTTDPEIIDLDSIDQYEVTIDLDRAGDRWSGIVEHRYGDGAWALIAKALAAADVRSV